MQQDVFHLAYMSEATESWSDDKLEELLERARHFNHSRNISGVLIANSGYFFQLLEGPKAPVNELYLKIMQDVRHSNVQCLYSGAVKQRIFTEWSMAYKNMRDYAPGVQDIFNDFRRSMRENNLESRTFDVLEFVQELRTAY